MSAHYGLTDEQILRMPIKRFWLFSECVDRLQASADLRTMNVHAVLNSKEAANELIERLNNAVGTVVVKDYERDKEGVSRLKNMLSMR